MILKSGKYEGLTLDEIFSVDPRYCMNIVEQKTFRKAYPEMVAYLEEKIASNPAVFETNVLLFGKYYGMTADDVILERKNAKYLLGQSWVAKQYPKVIERLRELYDIYYLHNPDFQSCYFYVLTFKDAKFIKVGITKQENVIRRMYNYLYDYTDYASLNIDISKSFVYKTNCMEIEKEVLKELAEYRLDKKSERIEKLKAKDIDQVVQKIVQSYSGYAIKKNLKELIPFRYGEAWKEKFYVPINDFGNFENRFIQMLWEEGKQHAYDPNFVDTAN